MKNCNFYFAISVFYFPARKTSRTAKSLFGKLKRLLRKPKCLFGEGNVPLWRALCKDLTKKKHDVSEKSRIFAS